MDGEWLSVKQLTRLSYEEKEAYLRRQLEKLSEAESDSEEVPLEPAEQEADAELEPAIDDLASDAEDTILPEYNPEDDDSDNDDDLAEELGNESVEQPAPVEYKARDGTVWSEVSPLPRRNLSHNILKSATAGPTKKTLGLNILETFKLIITNEICDIIIRETNRKGAQSYQAWNAEHLNETQRIWKTITATEFDAYLGIILFAGVSRSRNEHTQDLWSSCAHPLYRATMGLQRFYTINRYIRFDNGNTRSLRLLGDKAAAISDIWLMLNRNLQEYFVAGANITVDEQLFPYRGGTRFTQYIPSKPARYGIKVWWVCDSSTSYPIKGQIYTGMDASGQRETNQGERVVKDLCCNLFRGSGRNITCDNFFTTYNLASSLMLDFSLSILGTVNKRRRFIPPNFLIVKGQPRPVQASVFGFSSNITMCSYFPKKNKAVVLLSTMHYDKEIQGSANKPTMILDYNRTKGGVDNMDKMVGEYSCKRRTNRWPQAFFYNILDVAALAAFIIYKENNTFLKTATNSRRRFLQKLCEQLVMPGITQRSKNVQITRHFSTKNGIEAMLGHTLKFGSSHLLDSSSSALQERDATGRITHKGNCYLCSKRRSTRKLCANCEKPVCVQHSLNVTSCVQCQN